MSFAARRAVHVAAFVCRCSKSALRHLRRVRRGARRAVRIAAFAVRVAHRRRGMLPAALQVREFGFRTGRRPRRKRCSRTRASRPARARAVYRCDLPGNGVARWRSSPRTCPARAGSSGFVTPLRRGAVAVDGVQSAPQAARQQVPDRARDARRCSPRCSSTFAARAACRAVRVAVVGHFAVAVDPLSPLQRDARVPDARQAVATVHAERFRRGARHALVLGRVAGRRSAAARPVGDARLALALFVPLVTQTPLFGTGPSTRRCRCRR